MRVRASRRPPVLVFGPRLVTSSGNARELAGVGGRLNVPGVTLVAWLVIELRLMGEN